MRWEAWTVVVALGVSGCQGRVGQGAPDRPRACASRTPVGGPHAEPYDGPVTTRLAYRAEERDDGSVRMTVGDVDEAPADPRAVRVVDFRHPDTQGRCEAERITRVRGWWCTTEVAPVRVEGEIVVGGAKPRARIAAKGFTTRCHGRPGRMRQVSLIERDSWSGWRDYTEESAGAWTRAQTWRNGTVGDLCPRGRTGTYDYRLAVRIEMEHVTVGSSWAGGAVLRTDCGTGVS